MFASEAVLDEAGLEVVDVEETTAPRLSDGEIEAEVEQFTSFLDEIDPADFEDSP
jgi:hypothetical protein